MDPKDSLSLIKPLSPVVGETRIFPTSKSPELSTVNNFTSGNQSPTVPSLKPSVTLSACLNLFACNFISNWGNKPSGTNRGSEVALSNLPGVSPTPRWPPKLYVTVPIPPRFVAIPVNLNLL